MSRVAAACAVLFAAVAMGGEYNQTLNIGDAAPAWTDLPGTDGRNHSLAEIAADKLLVVVFTCNSCPIARDYEDRIIELSRTRADQLQVVAINVNTIAEDRLDKMKARAEERKFNFAYLYDESQQIARDFGATGTPEFFLLSRAVQSTDAAGTEGLRRTILYMGAMDDSSKVDQVKKHYLDDAIAAALSGGKPPVAETFAHGCRIRFARTRRKRSED